MSRKLLVGLAVIVVIILAWITISRMNDGVETADAPVDAPLTTTEEADEVVVVPDQDAEPETNVDEAVDGADAEVLDTETVAVDEVDDAGDALETTVDETGDAVDDAADATGEAVEDAGAALDDAADEAEAEIEGETESLTADADAEVTTTTVPLTDEGAEGTDAAEVETTTVPLGTGTATAEVPTDADLPELLTEDGFEAEPLIAYVEASDLSDAEKADLTAQIEAAQEDETLVPALVEDMRTQFDVE